MGVLQIVSVSEGKKSGPREVQIKIRYKLLHLRPAAKKTPAAEPASDASLNGIQPLDVLTIRAVGTLADQPINGPCLVEPDGQVALGPAYGRVNVKGLTWEQAEGKIREHLKAILTNPEVQLTLALRGPSWREAVLPKTPYKIGFRDVLSLRAIGVLPAPNDLAGLFRVEPTGTLALGPAYGRVQVKGLTLEEAEKAIEKKLRETFIKPEVQVTLVRPADQKELWRETAPPKSPYSIGPGTLLSVRAVGVLADHPIADIYVVEPTGTIALGPAYGRVQVQGLTLDAAAEAIHKKLKEMFNSPQVYVTFAGWHDVAALPAGSIKSGEYGLE
jgi:protein involved in polysaccharide export with SLBB domain